jgi:hypothetical protein
MGVNNIPSVINQIDPDRLLPDGTLYFYPFKLVPVIHLIKQMDKNSDEFIYDDNERPLELSWVAKTGGDYSSIVFRVFEDSKEKYIPVGDLVVAGPDDATKYLGNDYSKLLNFFEKTTLLSAFVLYVKDDGYSSKILTDGDFVQIDDDSGSDNYFDISIWAAQSRNVTDGEQQTEDYIILSDVVGKHYNESLGLNSTTRRKIAAVNKNYFSKVDGFHWEKDTGTADWNGIQNSGYISYSSPFANTFFADGISSGNGRYYKVESEDAKFSPAVTAGVTVAAFVVLGPIGGLVGLMALAKEKTVVHVRNQLNFFDIRPLSVTRSCCAGLNTHKLSEYCDDFNNQETGKVQCVSNMNEYCKGENLKTEECIAWCKKEGNYCDTEIIKYCKNKDLSRIPPVSHSPTPSPSSSSSYTTLKSNKILDAVVTNKGQTRNSTEEKCKQSCSKKDDCDACVFNIVTKSCDLYQDKNIGSIKSTTTYSANDTIFYKDKIKQIDPRSDMKTCACFKDLNFYSSYFNKATGKYPPEIQDLITLTSGTRDRRCYYPECTNPDNIKNKTLKQNPGQCGDQNIQVCFQDINQSGVNIIDSELENKQRLDCVNNIQNITGKTISPETMNKLKNKKYACSDNLCIISDGGEYDTKEDCESACSAKSDNTIIYAIIAGIVVFFLLIITILLIK